jgi:membrane-associated phospholipid phosphatase
VRRTAQAISVIFHPLLMTTYLFAVLTYYLPSILQPLRASWWFTLLIFGMTFVLPASNFLFFKVSGTIKDLTLFNRTDRLVPFAFISILYGVVTLMFFWKFPVPGVLKLMTVVTGMILISAMITLFYKLSIHTVAMWGMIGMLLPLNKASEEAVLLIPTIVAVLVAGLVMSARLQLNAHTPREVLVGALVGFAAGFAGIVVFF